MLDLFWCLLIWPLNPRWPNSRTAWPCNWRYVSMSSRITRLPLIDPGGGRHWGNRLVWSLKQNKEVELWPYVWLDMLTQTKKTYIQAFLNLKDFCTFQNPTQMSAMQTIIQKIKDGVIYLIVFPRLNWNPLVLTNGRAQTKPTPLYRAMVVNTTTPMIPWYFPSHQTTSWVVDWHLAYILYL